MMIILSHFAFWTVRGRNADNQTKNRKAQRLNTNGHSVSQEMSRRKDDHPMVQLANHMWLSGLNHMNPSVSHISQP